MDAQMTLEMLFDNHESAITRLNNSVTKISVDLSVLISEHEHLREMILKIDRTLDNNKQKDLEFYEKFSKLEASIETKASLWKAVKDNAQYILLVGLPFLGMAATALYEVGKYLRNLPVN